MSEFGNVMGDRSKSCSVIVIGAKTSIRVETYLHELMAALSYLKIFAIGAMVKFTGATASGRDVPHQWFVA